LLRFPYNVPVLRATVQQARCAKGWSIEKLSKGSGVPARLIRQIESQSPSYASSENNTALLGDALRIPVELLLGRGSACLSGGGPEEATQQGVRN
jgi:transcriptional regulator with XRE-family HTH domain